MKVAIITLHNIKNYGSALQTYATQYVIKKLNFDSVVIDYYRKDLLGKNIVDNRVASSRVFSKNFFTRFIGKILIKKSFSKQFKIFDDFKQKYLSLTKPYNSYEELVKDCPKADIYCTGSDQVWNSTWNRGIDKSFYLDFVKNKKKISYAASFGKTEIDSNEQNIIKPMLEDYDYITVREMSALKVLEDMGIQNAKLVLDPTLLLNENDWKKIACNVHVKGKYILVYQLDSKNKKFDKYVKDVSKKLKVKVIRVSNVYYQKYKYGKFIFCPSVNAFVELFLNASYVITDSFHATAFSINFNKKFMSIFPDEFSTRIQSILTLTHLENRRVTDYDNLLAITKDIDYNKVNKIINIERKKSLNSLEEMLKWNILW